MDVIKGHFNRYKSEMIYGSTFFAVMLGMIGAFYPGDDGIEAYIKIVEEAGMGDYFGDILNVTGYQFWVSLIFHTYAYYVLAIVSIFIGAKLIPTYYADGMELLIGTTSKTPRRFYIENILAGVMTVLVLMLPGTYILFSSTLIITDSFSLLDELFFSMIFVAVIALFFIALSSFFSIYKFSSSAGKKAGIIYFAYAFVIEIVANSNPDYTDYGKTSVHTYLNPNSGFLYGKFDWDHILHVLIIVILLFATSYYLLIKKELIEKEDESQEKEKRKAFNLEKIFPKSWQKTKPIFMEQIREDSSRFTWWVSIISFIIFLIGFMYPGGDATTEAMSAFDSPIIKLFTLGHEVPPSFAGFIGYESYGVMWLYCGLFSTLTAASIVTRDTLNSTQDFLWGNNFRYATLIYQRTLAVLVEITIYISVFFTVSVIGTFLAGGSINYLLYVEAYSVLWLSNIGLVILVTGLTMLSKPSVSRKYAIWFYSASLIILLIGFSSENTEFLRYLSLFYWIDPVGIIYEDVNLLNQYLNQIVLIMVSIPFYFVTLKRFEKHDIN
jgi:hypothetical protein